MTASTQYQIKIFDLAQMPKPESLIHIESHFGGLKNSDTVAHFTRLNQGSEGHCGAEPSSTCDWQGGYAIDTRHASAQENTGRGNRLAVQRSKIVLHGSFQTQL